ncbi:unnamed protein product [Cladocopium goreaui]|uniref:EF-hand domain-containing protein n=1 Tax=Cladocopium goreaui TaxID=2562237 RepID=A0A9P1CC06_9DINO|nr:unnamed protein product [Cladocopium goreaui]
MLLHISQLQVPNLRTAPASSSVPARRSQRFYASHISNASRASGSARIQALGCTVFLGAACLRRVAQKAIPTEYYGLLGLLLFTSDPKEIKAAHRRMVKLVHPDILGADSSDLQSIVTEACTMLSDQEKKEEYDEKLRKAKPSLSKSNWSEDAPQFAMGVFVDETKCEQCYRCVNIASSTFEIHDNPVREGKAFVTLQYGDDRYVVREAIGECPSKAIRYVSREDLTKLEYAMTQCATLRHRARPWEKETIQGPYELYQELMLDELISMDMEKAREQELREQRARQQHEQQKAEADAARAKEEQAAAAKAQVLNDPLLRGLHQRAKKNGFLDVNGSLLALGSWQQSNRFRIDYAVDASQYFNLNWRCLPVAPCETEQLSSAVHVVIVGPVWGEPFTARERMEISLKHGQRCPGFSGVDSGYLLILLHYFKLSSALAILEEDNPQWKQDRRLSEELLLTQMLKPE